MPCLCRLKRYMVVEVTFLDHVEGGDDLLLFKVYGRILRVTKDSITIGSWVSAEQLTPDRPELDYNTTKFTIGKAMIKTYRELR